MVSRAFPLGGTHTRTLDGISGSLSGDRGSASLEPDDSGSLRSLLLSRGRRISVVSFAEGTVLHTRYAVEVLGERPFVRPSVMMVDSLARRNFRSPVMLYAPVPFLVLPTKEMLYAVDRGFHDFGESLSIGISGFRLGFSLVRAAYAPLIGAMAIGMVSALLLEHSFGAGVSAEEQHIVYVNPDQSRQVLGANDESEGLSDDEHILSALAGEDADKKKFGKKIQEMVRGYPIENMVPYIVEQDRTVAMFLISIAKKESNWGKRVPVLDGQDCFNYWGYRGQRKLMGTGGHTCFNSRQDAVETVGKRLKDLIYKYKLDTPADLIVWKCGSSCAGHSPYSVRKWISDVDIYYNELNKGED